MISGLLCFVLVATTGGRLLDSGYVVEVVDMIELNHFFDRNGRHIYDQIIFYERVSASGQFRVRAWCLVEDRESLNRRPQWNATNNMYHVDWLDSDQSILRSIRSRLYRESWSQVDPERRDKKVLEERYRLSLVRPSRDRSSAQQEEKSQRIAALLALQELNGEGNSEVALTEVAINTDGLVRK
jgi:hypothetical protein